MISSRIHTASSGSVRMAVDWYATMLSFNQLTRFGFNEKGEVNSVLSTSYPYNAPDLGICDVYRRGTVVLCNNGVVSEFSVKNNQLVAKNISSLFPPLEGRYAGAIISYEGVTSLQYYQPRWDMNFAMSYSYSKNFTISPQVKSSSNFENPYVSIQKFLLKKKLDKAFDRQRNRIVFSVSYRFADGKSVRQYNRDMSTED